jgi:hypothetical protein
MRWWSGWLSANASGGCSRLTGLTLRFIGLTGSAASKSCLDPSTLVARGSLCPEPGSTPEFIPTMLRRYGARSAATQERNCARSRQAAANSEADHQPAAAAIPETIAEHGNLIWSVRLFRKRASADAVTLAVSSRPVSRPLANPPICERVGPLDLVV